MLASFYFLAHATYKTKTESATGRSCEDLERKSRVVKMGRSHVLALPYPAQGHVIPLLEVAQCLARNDIKVTFVNSDFNNGRMMKALSHPPGTPLKQEMIQLCPEMPALSSSKLTWLHLGDFTTQKLIFHSMLHNKYEESEKLIDYIVCNSSYDLEPGALKLVPQCVPIGPLLASSRLGRSAGFFWAEDSASLSWLDQQPPNSTIYVSFGSSTFLDEIHFHELALGLEMTNRPFLWVVRPDLIQNSDRTPYPEGFNERIENRGKMVGWAPQQAVLSHPAVACFVSHCGWNSTMESVSNGVPLLCWPYYADQFLNEGYISDYWKVGLRLEKDESGVIRRDEIEKKVEVLVMDESYKSRALNLQSKAIGSVAEGGRSRQNFHKFVDWINK